MAYIVFGGIHPSLFAGELLKEYADCIDFVIKGEGEVSLVKLLVELGTGKVYAEWPHIHGLCYADNGNIIINQPIPLDLSSEDTMLNFTFWPCDVPFIPRINLSRGCKGSCVYCSANRAFNSTYRLRDMENITADIENCVKHGFHKILIGDLSFGCNKEIAIEVCRFIIEHKLDIEWWAQMRLKDCDSELLQFMSLAGCKQIAIGFESVEPKILSTMAANKSNTRGTYDICKEINDLGISIQGYFVIGLPGDTIESILQTTKYIESLLSYNMTYVHLSVCVPFPGTDLYEHPEKYNIEIVDHNYDHYTMNADPNTALPVFNGPYLSRYQVHSLWLNALATVEKHLAKREQVALDDAYNNVFCRYFQLCKIFQSQRSSSSMDGLRETGKMSLSFGFKAVSLRDYHISA